AHSCPAATTSVHRTHRPLLSAISRPTATGKLSNWTTVAMDDASALIDKALVALATRPDADKLRAKLADAFVDHAAGLWPQGDPNATPVWIEANVAEILAALERLYGRAHCLPVAHEFLARMLPELLGTLERPRLDS